MTGGGGSSGTEVSLAPEEASWEKEYLASKEVSREAEEER